MFKTPEEVGTISDNMTQDTGEKQTVSPLPSVPISEITIPPQQNTLNRPREPEILGTSPLFVSWGSQGVGSIYYPEGRMRLFHPRGPSVEEYIPYRISILDPTVYPQIKQWMKEFYSGNQSLPKLTDFQQEFKDYYKDKIFQDVGSLLETHQVMPGMLFELHLDKEGSIIGFHPSEGVVTPYPATGVGLDTDFLYYIIEYIEEIAAIIISSYANKIDFVTAKQEIQYLFTHLLSMYDETDKEDIAIQSIEMALKDVLTPKKINNAYEYAFNQCEIKEFIKYIKNFKKENNALLKKSDFCLFSATTSEEIDDLYKKFITPYQGNWLIFAAQDISKDLNQDIDKFIRQNIFDVWLKDNHCVFYQYMKGYLTNLLLEQTHVIEQTKLHTRKSRN